MKDLPDSITVPIDDLDLDKRIVAGDIKLDKVNVLTDKDAVICMVRTTRNVEAAVETAAEEGEEAVEGAEEGEAKAEE
jgi:large subunit ribosomal protein L25